MLLLHIAYSEKDVAAHIQLAFGQYSHAACLYVFEIHRKKSHPGKAFTRQGQEIIKRDDWNDIRIVCEGNHVRIWINGEERVDFTDKSETDTTQEGFFGMQVHSGGQTDVRWKNLRIKEL